MKVTMFGAGYVGLVTGTCLAKLGHDVVCIDVDTRKIALLNEGKSPLYEPGLTELMQEMVNQNRLQFTTNIKEAIAHGELLFIAVGTPPQENGSADLRYVVEVADAIGEHMDTVKIVVDKSTVPVGTAEEVAKRIQAQLIKRNVTLSFDVVSNPEFLKEGAAINDFLYPDRIVLGLTSQLAEEKLRKLYSAFPSEKIFVMDTRSAELSKYAANAMLATRISFMNEMSRLAEILEADIEKVRLAIGADDRIGPRFLNAGCGYGGSCFPKDVSALAHLAQVNNVATPLLDSVMQVNDQQKNRLFQKVQAYFNGSISDKTIAVWGLSFKPNTDDIREAPSRVLIEALWNAGAKVKAYDPVAGENFVKTYGERSDFSLCESVLDTIKGADALVIVTEWDEFRKADLSMVRQQLNNPVIFDGRNLYDPIAVQNEGMTYFSIGRIPA